MASRVINLGKRLKSKALDADRPVHAANPYPAGARTIDAYGVLRAANRPTTRRAGARGTQ